MKTFKKIILPVFLAIIVCITVYSFISYKKQSKSFSDGTVKITDDGQYTIETENGITVLKLYGKESQTPDELLRYVTDTKRKKNKFYVKAGEGYAVINTDNKTCKIHILLNEWDFVKLYGYDENKNVIYKSRFSENSLVTYCDYDDIGNESKLIFYTME